MSESGSIRPAGMEEAPGSARAGAGAAVIGAGRNRASGRETTGAAAGRVSKPLLIYDGECGFCRASVEKLRRRTGDRVDYAPSQEVGGHFPQIRPDEFARAVQLVEPDGRVFSGADGILRVFRFMPRRAWLYWVYRWVPGVAFIARRVYGVIARKRKCLSGSMACRVR